MHWIEGKHRARELNCSVYSNAKDMATAGYDAIVRMRR